MQCKRQVLFYILKGTNMKQNLTTGSVPKTVLVFALPYLLSYFLQTLYGMADLFITGQFYGVDSITAVANGSQVMHMITVILVGLAMGATVIIGRAVGGNRMDEAGKAVSKTVKIKVKAKRATPKISNVKNIYIKSKSQMTKKTVLKNVVITQKGIKLDAKYVKVTFKKLKKNVYRVTYIAKRESYEAKKTAKVYIDTKAPVISGIKNGAQYEAESDAVINDEYCRGFISGVSDNYTKIKVSDINIKINSTEIEGRYEVVYTVKDEAGNQAKYTIYIVKKAGTASGGAIS